MITTFVVCNCAVVQEVLQEPSKTMNVKLCGDSSDMSAVFKLNQIPIDS